MPGLLERKVIPRLPLRVSVFFKKSAMGFGFRVYGLDFGVGVLGFRV